MTGANSFPPTFGGGDASPDQSPSRLVTKRKVALLLGKSRRTIDRWDADTSPSRTFPQAIRLAGRKHWWHDEIVRWLSSLRTTSPPSKPVSGGEAP
jgi:predicted DNA-binding transcriptional regulator AlpA